MTLCYTDEVLLPSRCQQHVDFVTSPTVSSGTLNSSIPYHTIPMWYNVGTPFVTCTIQYNDSNYFSINQQSLNSHWPLQRIARLNPSASAVPEFMFSTTLCFTFFRTTQQHNSTTLSKTENDQQHSTSEHQLHVVSIKFIISVAHCRLDFTINSSIQI